MMRSSSLETAVMDACLAAYPDGMSTEEMKMRLDVSSISVEKAIEELIRDGSIEVDGEFIHING